MAFWYAFNEKHEDYTHADDSRYYDPELKEQVDRDAQEAGVKQKSVANNDELLSYAAYVYATALAIKVADYIGTSLDDLAKADGQAWIINLRKAYQSGFVSNQ